MRLPMLTHAAAAQLDRDLMSTPGFSLDQLMELAGLSVACAVAAAFPACRRVLTFAGPGNNGGDALVAARHLAHFGFEPTVVVPKTSFANLITQLHWLDVPVLTSAPPPAQWPTEFDIVLDGVFGFSFNAADGVRKPYDSILAQLRNTTLPIAAIDIPSGWHVEKGDVHQLGVAMPDLLISLTAPKLCAAFFTGKQHYLGGRFLPPKLAAKYQLEALPKYPGTAQCVEVSDYECVL